MKRLFFTGFLVCALAACGNGNNDIVVGDNNDRNNDNNATANNDPADMGGNNDNNVEDTGSNNDPSDTGTQDTGSPEDMRAMDDTGTAEDMSPPPDMSTPEDMAMPEDMSMMNCPGSNIAYGQACLCDSECITGVCLDAAPGSPGVCSKACTQRSDCPLGQDACVPAADGNGNVCRPDDTGDNCDNGGAALPSMCAQDTCVQAGGTNATPSYFCSVPCTTASDCQIGHACSPVRCMTSTDGERSCIPGIVAARAGAQEAQLLTAFPDTYDVCVPLGATLDPGCSANLNNEQICTSGMGDCSADRCTAPCDETADCPAGGCALFTRTPAGSDQTIMVCQF